MRRYGSGGGSSNKLVFWPLPIYGALLLLFLPAFLGGEGREKLGVAAVRLGGGGGGFIDLALWCGAGRSWMGDPTELPRRETTEGFFEAAFFNKHFSVNPLFLSCLFELPSALVGRGGVEMLLRSTDRAVDRMDFLLQVLQERTVDVPELEGKYVVSIIGVDED